MSKLQKENVNGCISLLREFIDGTGDSNPKKGIAVLALDQLRRITAGTDAEAPDQRVVCITKPRAS